MQWSFQSTAKYNDDDENKIELESENKAMHTLLSHTNDENGNHTCIIIQLEQYLYIGLYDNIFQQFRFDVALPAELQKNGGPQP